MQSPVRHIRLSELNQKIGAAIFNTFSNASYWVVADVTSHSFRDQKGYHSFVLVEKDTMTNRILAQIPGKAWGAGADRIFLFEKQTGQKFTNNINVLVNVSVEYHPVYGLQVNLVDIDPAFTLGVLEQQRRNVLDELVKKNPEFIQRVGDRFITKNNQLKLNVVIQRIAIISSKTSAGAEDFLHTLENNPFGYRFWVDNYHTVVQGESNADQFLAKIIEVFNSGKPYDAVVIARGGGAQTDFLMFDSYSIGRAIARFPIPIITGIGHQKNETIADLMAHTQTKTPTKAAEFIIAHNRTYEDKVMSLQQRIVNRSQRMLANSLHQVESLKEDIINCSRSMIASNQRTLEHFRSLVRVARPDNILKRGFAIVRSGNKILTDADKIEVGSNVEIVMSGSILNTTVNQKTKRDGAGTDL